MTLHFRRSDTIIRTYRADSLVGLKKEMKRRRGALGMVTTSYPWSWNTSIDWFDFGANLGVDLTLAITLKLPSWSPGWLCPWGEQKEWRRFLHALTHHEQGHIEIHKKEARVMYRRLCKATSSTVEAVYESERSRIRKLNKAYDKKTYGTGTPYGPIAIRLENARQ